MDATETQPWLPAEEGPAAMASVAHTEALVAFAGPVGEAELAADSRRVLEACEVAGLRTVPLILEDTAHEEMALQLAWLGLLLAEEAMGARSGGAGTSPGCPAARAGMEEDAVQHYASAAASAEALLAAAGPIGADSRLVLEACEVARLKTVALILEDTTHEEALQL
eukprot:CAMPEP_0170289340 /NCGR_PEP_ID=MMETSP0116_2-20130129/44736_1 /TAXON_ID=400756 /ORGANISM="Durinskia baltica, Strain CSIRO CS-38" /LENGTH=166 /DNA_ID=CAMNT_0010540775 /DNA_START=17 /DNA_END=514 /DNA_ORIENTATION=-